MAGAVGIGSPMRCSMAGTEMPSVSAPALSSVSHPRSAELDVRVSMLRIIGSRAGTTMMTVSPDSYCAGISQNGWAASAMWSSAKYESRASRRGDNRHRWTRGARVCASIPTSMSPVGDSITRAREAYEHAGVDNLDPYRSPSTRECNGARAPCADRIPRGTDAGLPAPVLLHLCVSADTLAALRRCGLLPVNAGHCRVRMVGTRSDRQDRASTGGR